MRPKYKLSRTENETYILLLLLFDYIGILRFIKGEPLPDDQQLSEALLSRSLDRYKAKNGGKLPEYIQVKGGQEIPYAQKICETADNIHETFRHFAKNGDKNGQKAFRKYLKDAYTDLSQRPKQQKNIQILTDLAMREATQRTTEEIAEKHGYTPQQINNIKHKMLKALAKNITARRDTAKYFGKEVKKWTKTTANARTANSSRKTKSEATNALQEKLNLATST